jgi:hypothetical protein
LQNRGNIKAFTRYINQQAETPAAPPRKRRVHEYLMNHPDHRTRVCQLSEETGRADRLNCRRVAAMKLFEEMSEEDRQKIHDHIEEMHKEAIEAYEELNDPKTSNEDASAVKDDAKKEVRERWVKTLVLFHYVIDMFVSKEPKELASHCPAIPGRCS